MENNKLHLFDLPRELMVNTMMFCKVHDLFVFSNTCKYFQNIFRGTFWPQTIKPKQIKQLINVLKISNFLNYDITQLRIYDKVLLQQLNSVAETITYNPNYTVNIIKYRQIQQFYIRGAASMFNTYFKVTGNTLKIYLMNDNMDRYNTNHNIIWKTKNQKIINGYLEYLREYDERCDNGYVCNFLVNSYIPDKLIYFAAQAATKIISTENPELQKTLRVLFHRETFDSEDFLEKINFYSKFLPEQTLEIRINEVILQFIDKLIAAHPTVRFTYTALDDDIDFLIRISYLDTYINAINTEILFFGSITYANIIKFERRCNPRSFIKKIVSDLWYHDSNNILVLPLIDIDTQPIETCVKWFRYTDNDTAKLQYVYDLLKIESLDLETKKEFLSNHIFDIFEENIIIWCLEKNKNILMKDEVLREKILYLIIEKSLVKVFEWWESMFTYDIIDSKRKIIIYDYAMLETLLQSDLRGYQYVHQYDYYYTININATIEKVISSGKKFYECIDVNSVFWHGEINIGLLEILFEGGDLKLLDLPSDENMDILVMDPMIIMWLHKKKFLTRNVDPVTGVLESFFRWKGQKKFGIKWTNVFKAIFNHADIDSCIDTIKNFHTSGIDFLLAEWPDKLLTPYIPSYHASNFDKIFDILITLPECSQRNYFIVSRVFDCKTPQECAEFLFKYPEWIEYFILQDGVKYNYVTFLADCQKLSKQQSSNKQCNVDILINSLMRHLFETMFTYHKVCKVRQIEILEIIEELDYFHKIDPLVEDMPHQREWWQFIKQLTN